jgi:hypothetical protein
MKTIDIKKLESVCGGIHGLPQFPGMSLGEAYAWRSGMWKDAPGKRGPSPLKPGVQIINGKIVW